MIAAVSSNWGIGLNGNLLFNIREDLKHFKDITYGSDIVMGRKTYESLPNLLPGRRHIVLTRKKRHVDDVIFTTFDDFLSHLKTKDTFIIGGSEIYELCANLCDQIILTHIDKIADADAFFPFGVLDNYTIDSETVLIPGLAKVVKYNRIR